MSDPFLPTTGRWPCRPRRAAALGWALAGVLVLGATRGLPGRLHSLPFEGAGARITAQRAATAAATMRRAEAFLWRARIVQGVLPEGEAAGDRSGLLGGELTPLMTTLGSLEAKRLSTNPEWARVLTVRLAEAGIGAGDLVAASFSGSFPGLNLALASACQALNADLLAISSVTASTWGANQPGFTWPEMEAMLVGAGIIRRASIAVTAGGDADIASDLDMEGRALARHTRDVAARRLGVAALRPGDFRDAVTLRLAAYRRAANGRRIALYANVGGAEASIGRSAAFLRLRSGFLPAVPFGRPAEQGVTAHLARDGVRVLVLLNVRDLALRWGIPLAGPGN